MRGTALSLGRGACGGERIPAGGCSGPWQSGLSALSSGPAPGSLQPLDPRGKEALEPRPPGAGLGLGTFRSTTLRRGVNAVSRTGSMAVEAGALFHLDGVRCIFRNNFQPDSHVPVPLGGEWPRVSSESRSSGRGCGLYRPGPVPSLFPTNVWPPNQSNRRRETAVLMGGVAL